MSRIAVKEPIHSLTSMHEQEYGTHQGDAGFSRALHAAHEAIVAVLPEILERSITEPHFRSSLLQDTHLTINAVIAKSAPHVNQISTDISIRLVENEADTVCLVIPPPSERVRMDHTKRSPVGDILFDAAWDEALKNELLANPVDTFARELAKRGQEVLGLPAELKIRVVASEPGELVVVLPIVPRRSVEFTASTANDFGIDGATPIAASTNYDSCRYTMEYCSTVLTANNACGTSGCYTHTYECRR